MTELNQYLPFIAQIMKPEVEQMKQKRFWSKRPLIHSAFRLSEDERDLWRSAAMKQGVSLNDFVRAAIRERSKVLLGGEENQSALRA